MPGSTQASAARVLRRARQGRVLCSLVAYTVLAPFGYALFALVYAAGSRDPLRRAWRMQRLTARAYRIMHTWMRLARITGFDHRGALSDVPAGPCVVVANHPTLMDVTAITAALGGGCTIAKPALYRRPGLHTLLVGAGHLEGPAQDPVAVGRVMAQATERLREGFSLIIFPEGTRSPPGRMLRFGRAAFEIACRARVPVVSVAVRCEPIWLSKEVPLLDPPHPMPQLQLRYLASDDPATVDYDSHRLRQAVEARFHTWSAGARTDGRAALTTTRPGKDLCPTLSKTA